MYQYKAAKARTKGLAAEWKDVDLSTVDINTLFTTYAKVILTLTHVSVSHDLYLDMDDARPQIPPSFKPRTIQQWLTSLGPAALPTHDSAPIIRERIVRYRDAWLAGYDIVAVDRKRAWNAQLPEGEKNDLLLRRSDVDFTNLWRYCMVSVNGLFHHVGGSPEGLYVVEGGRTGAIKRDNHVGLLSFRDVAALEYIPIVAGMVYKTHPDQKYADYANVKLPKPVVGKTILLVLGGYLHVLDNAYQQTGPSSVRINFNRIPLPERVFESFDRINLDSLQLTPSPNNDRQFVREELLADDTLAAYLTLPQSFFVVVDTPYLFARETQVENSKLPGRYITKDPMEMLPLFSAMGRHCIYKPTREWGRVVLSSEPAHNYDYNFRTHQWHTQLSLDDKTYSAKPWDFAQARLLTIGRYTEEFA